ncbi:MAG: ABC transporter ATP-binding protein [Bdellovibrionia bacterium]
MDYAIELNNVSKHFSLRTGLPFSFKQVLVNALRGKVDFGSVQSFQALSDVSFQIRPGEFVGIMGRNGAGKSTLMKLICGIYTPSSGQVSVCGRIAPLIELGAGFNGDLTGEENIYLNAAILGFGRKAAQEAMPLIVEFSELKDFIQVPVRNYSSGMLMRLGFSIAVHLDAPILLLDEVLAVGDVGFQKKCLDRIRALHQKGKTILLITHDPSAIEQFTDRCIVIEERKKIFDGDPKEGCQIYRDVTLR